MIEVFRREIWLVDLNPPGKGREIHKARPALVVSADEFNNCPAELVIILPITSTKTGIPSHIKIEPPEGGVKKTSFIKCDQIKTISKARLIKKWGIVSPRTVSKVESALRFLLCL